MRSWSSRFSGRIGAAAVLAMSVAGLVGIPAQATQQQSAPHTPTSAHAALSTTAVSNAAKTPPMGWNDWAHYQCNFDENTILRNADALVSTGLAASGYNTVTVDDCWMLKTRDSQGNLATDPGRFPHGMAWLGQQLHAKGLRFGIYEDAGTATCGGYAGSWGHFAADTNLFAKWKVDYLKLDGCNVPSIPGQSDEQTFRYAYAEESTAIRQSGRNIEFSESAPAYFEHSPDWYKILGWVGKYGQLWREGDDVATFDPAHPDTSRWSSVLGNYDYNHPLTRYARPGNYNDPDFLIGGAGGMTTEESRSQIALWAMESAPLILSSDVAKIPQQTLNAFRNPDLLALDKDPAGAQATVSAQNGSADVLYKPLANGDRAVTLFNRADTPATLSTTPANIGYAQGCHYTAKNLWTGAAATALRAKVPAHGTAVFRLTPGAGCGAPTPTGQLLSTTAQCLTSGPNGTVAAAPCAADATQRAQRNADGSLRVQGKCLAEGPNGLGFAACGTGKEQHWLYQESGNLVNESTGQCVQAPDPKASDHAVTATACGDHQLNQIWTLPA